MLTRPNLHNYQKKGVDFILKKNRCALFLDMGMGKTATTLTAMSDMLDSFLVSNILVIAPLRVANSVWKQEADKWEHLNHLTFGLCTGSAARRKAVLQLNRDIYLINRENVLWLVEECKKSRKWPFDCVIIDESSSFKNPSTKRFKKLKTVLKYINTMILLTGTPSPNGLLDVWSQMYLIDRGERLGKTMGGYKKRFFDPDFFGYNWTLKPGSENEIHELMKDRVLSMSAKDYLEVPKRIDMIEWIDLPETVYKAYKKFERDLLIELEDGEELEATTAAVLANKLLQWSNGAVYTDDAGAWSEVHKSKLTAIEDIINDNPNENILVAYNYKTDLIRLKKKFPSAVVLGKNPSVIDQWNRGEIKLMLAHPASCGHGINIQYGGSMIVWFGLTWSLELDQQMNARLDRQGQKNPVRVVRIIANKTIDERVMDAIRNKTSVQKELLNALKQDYIQLKSQVTNETRH